MVMATKLVSKLVPTHTHTQNDTKVAALVDYCQYHLLWFSVWCCRVVWVATALSKNLPGEDEAKHCSRQNR